MFRSSNYPWEGYYIPANGRTGGASCRMRRFEGVYGGMGRMKGIKKDIKR